MKATAKVLGAAVVAAGVAAASLAGPAVKASGFPGRNGRIVFSRPTASGSLDLVTDQLVNVTQTPETETSAAWSPTGNRIAFQRLINTQFDIFVVPVASNGTPTGQAVNITNSPAQDQHPSWSADGRRIAFDSNRTGNVEVFTVGRAGGTPRNVSRDTTTSDSTPTYSPIANEIAWTKGNNLAMGPDATSGTIVQLTNTAVQERDANFRPDGQSLVYIEREGNLFRIKAAPLDDMTDTTLLLEETQPIGGPKCSPDGQFLLYSRANVNGETTDTYRRSCQPGGGSVRLLPNVFSPDWQRLPG